MKNVWHVRPLLAAVVSLLLVACGADEPENPSAVPPLHGVLRSNAELERGLGGEESGGEEPAQGSSVVMPEELRAAFIESLQQEATPPQLSAYTTMPQGTLVAPAGASNDEFGIAVAIEGDRAVIGAHQDDAKGTDAGACYVFNRMGSTWTQETKLQASDGAAGDKFGWSVAIIGSYVVVGAPSADISGNVDRGAAYIFVNNGMIWSDTNKFSASDGAAGDQFGYSVAISTNSAAIGAPGHDSKATNAGAVYTFMRSGSTWSPPSKITANDGAIGDNFGQDVAMSIDTLVVGASLADIAGRPNQGAAYVYQSATMNQWTLQTKITAADGQADDRFGHSIAYVNGTIGVGAPFDDDATNGIDSGSMYLFTRIMNNWVQTAKLKASDGATNDQFGTAIALIEGLPFLAVAGAPLDDDLGTDSGSIYNFLYEGGTWAEQVKIKPSAGAAQDQFGSAVALSATTIIAGAFGDDIGANIDQGSAHIFRVGKADAVACTYGAECLRGYCADGLCCDNECNKNCQACTNALKGFGADGVCGPVVYGKAPLDPLECPTDFTNIPCGIDGTCDGAGDCRKVVPGTSCPGVSTCSNGSAIAPICNGLGACVDNTAVNCAPYVCHANGVTCATSCSSDAGCSVGNYCSNGACTEQIEIGFACVTSPQCKSKFCVDGVCCSTPCNGPCQVCTSMLQGGLGVDGYCGYAQEGTNPGNRCLTQDPTTCGTNGTCSAGGTCQFYAYDAACGDLACENNGVITKFCNGSGTCLTKSEPCGNYLCTAAACNKTCTDAADCIDGSYCQAGQCVADSSLGAPCTDDTGCSSGYCLESATDPAKKVCCSNACEDLGDSCGFTGQCNPFGACELHRYGDDCGTALCTGGLKYGDQICNGLGACVPNPSSIETCFPYICEGSDACKTTCVDDDVNSMESDCASGFYCRAGQCVAITRSCVSIDDCQAGEICDTEKNYCVTRPTTTTDSSACDCRVPGTPSNGTGLPSVCAAVLLLLARRRRNRNRNS